MLIVSGRGQVLVLDEPERHLAGECRRDEWAVTVEVVLDEPERHLAGECRRDDWAVTVVSACCPFSLRACGFCISALMFLCSGGCISRGVWGLRWRG